MPAPPRRIVADPEAGGPMVFDSPAMQRPAAAPAAPMEALDFAPAGPPAADARAQSARHGADLLGTAPTGPPPASTAGPAGSLWPPPPQPQPWPDEPTPGPAVSSTPPLGLDRPGPTAGGFHLNTWQPTSSAAAALESVPSMAVAALQSPPEATLIEAPPFPGFSPPAEEAGPGWGIRGGRPSQPWAPDPLDAAATTPAGGYGQGYPIVPYQWPAPPRAGAGKLIGRMALLLVPVLAVSGGLIYLRLHGGGSGTHSITMPTSIGGVLKNADSRFTTFAEQFKATASRAPGINDAQVGFYGQLGGGVPEFEIAVTSASHSLSHADIDSFVTGFNTTSGAAFSTSNATTTTDQGVDFICGPFTVAGQGQQLCLWIDGNVLGAVVGFTGVDPASTLAEAEATRAAAEH